MKGLIKSLIIILVIFVVIPITLLFVFVFDTSRMNVTYDENFNGEKWTNALVMDSLDHTVSEKKVKFSVTESDLNNFINATLKDSPEITQYLTQLAVDIKDDSYELSASGKFYFFETRARLSVKLSREMVSSGTEQKEALVLQIENLTLGKISKLKEVIMFFVKQFLSNDMMDNFAQDFNLHFDLANDKLFIYMDDLKALINDVASDDGGDSDFFFTFLNDFFDQNLITFNFYADEALSVEVDLEPLTGNDFDDGQYVYYPMEYDNTTTNLTIDGETKKLSLDVIKEALVALLNAGLIEEADLSTVSDYLFNGYEFDGLGNNAPDADLSIIGINNKTTYPGFNLVTATSLEDIVSSSVASFQDYDPGEDQFDLANIREADVNTFLKSQELFGNKFFLTREVEEDDYKVSYIALDNAYINLTDANAYMSLGLNLNGLETIITLAMANDDTNTDPEKLIYDVENIYFGAEEEDFTVSEGTRTFLFETLAETIQDGAFTFSNDGKMTISFDSFIDEAIDSVNTGNPVYDNMYKSFLQDDADFSIAVIGSQITDNSTVRITATRRL